MTRILVIDNESDVRQAYKTVFEKLECQVDTATDGIEGLERFMNKIYDVVISEFNLDLIDGMQMLEHFQQIDAKVPVIFSSGLADEAIIAEALDSGAAAFLPKTAHIDQLLVSMTKAMYFRPNSKTDSEGMPSSVTH